MGGASDRGKIRNSAHCIGRVRDRNQPGAPVDLTLEILHVDGALGDTNVGEAHNHASVLQGQPGRDIGVVFQASHDDLVARLQFSPDGAAHRKGERGHVGTEDDLFC